MYRKQMERLAEILFGRLENEKTYSGDIAPISEQLRYVLSDCYPGLRGGYFDRPRNEIEEAAAIKKNFDQRMAEVEELKAALNFRGMDSSAPVTITPPPDLCDFCTKEKNDGICPKCSGLRRINVNLNLIPCYKKGCSSSAKFAFNETGQGDYLKYCTKHTQEHLRQEVLEEAARNTPSQADDPEKILEKAIVKEPVCDVCLKSDCARMKLEIDTCGLKT